MKIEGMLRDLGRIRRQEARRVLQKRTRRAQLRSRMGQVLNAMAYLVLAGGVTAVLLSL